MQQDSGQQDSVDNQTGQWCLFLAVASNLDSKSLFFVQMFMFRNDF